MPLAVIDILATGAVAIAATVTGALLQRHFGRTARQELIDQSAAAEIDQQLHRLHGAVVRDQNSAGYAALHKQCDDNVAGIAWRLRDEELVRRVRVVGQVLVLAHMASKDDPFPPFAILHAIDDARAAAVAVMRRTDLPAAAFPPYLELQQLIRGPQGRRFEQLERWTAEHPAPVPWR